jgi:hypothetical protein
MDWSHREAVAEAYRDVRPLMDRHKLKWFISTLGNLCATCHCSPTTTRTWDEMGAHLTEVERGVRGPKRPPKKA